MKEIIRVSLLGLFFGTFGTTIGGIIGVWINKTTDKVLSFILSLAAGIMASVVSFELMPEATGLSGMFMTIFGILCGIVVMIYCDIIVKNKLDKKIDNKKSLLKTGIVISIGLAIHNIPEGLAIGTGFDRSIKLGYSLAIAIALHDIPEGVSMALPMKNGGIKPLKILLYVFLSGATTGLGALAGSLIGKTSDAVIALSMSFASGAMLYISTGELVPEYCRLNDGKISVLGNILGFLVGYITTQI